MQGIIRYTITDTVIIYNKINVNNKQMKYFVYHSRVWVVGHENLLTISETTIIPGKVSSAVIPSDDHRGYWMISFDVACFMWGGDIYIIEGNKYSKGI